MHRVRDPELFEAQLDAPLKKVGGEVSDAELEADAASFMAFAGMMGVAPPRSQAVPSSSSSGG